MGLLAFHMELLRDLSEPFKTFSCRADVADAEDLSGFPDGTFDVVTCCLGLMCDSFLIQGFSCVFHR